MTAWRNFDTEDLQHEVGPDGALTLTGKRTYEEQILEFTQTIRLTDGASCRSIIGVPRRPFN